ncbi:FtsX-like permease family protein [Leuconostoc koreense]|nr:FtsX-like permease family protein [Leuconostoc mesenteroides]QGM25656.1 FtsX-like permease family protein [Leuconostoc mesenteroides subsp. mesenteroides]
MLYWKLAWQSIIKNKLEYLPFMLAGSAAVALNMVIQLLIFSKGVKKIAANVSVIEMLTFSQIIIAIFSIIFLLYTYSFLSKRKKSEFGLFSILGLQKTDLIKISWRQQFISFMAITFFGLVSGVVFSKVLILLFMKLVGGTEFQLNITIVSIIFIVVFFMLCFLFLLTTDIFSILKLKTISLLHATEKGESEPKSHWVLFGLGLVLLTVGYYMSVTVHSPLKAISQFFIAVLLVVFATYILFIVASTIILKVMKRSGKYYYQANHFITVSNMLFRMKQSATGLASITLLTTMSLVVIVTTVSMFVGQEDYVNQKFPRAVILTNTSDRKVPVESVRKEARKNGIKISKPYRLEISTAIAGNLTNQGKLQPLTGDSVGSVDNWSEIQFITEKQYKYMDNSSANSLQANEIYVYDRQGTFNERSITFLNKKYHVKSVLKKIKGIPSVQPNMTHSLIVVVPSKSVTSTLGNAFNDIGDTKQNIIYKNQLLFNVTGTKQQREEFLKEVSQTYNITSEDRFSTMSVLKEFYGGFFFIGLVFSVSFIMATGLIIYYKQISEGRSDQKQFDILQKIGMSSQEVKKTIRSQIIWIFGLPVVVAIVHLCFAMPMIHKILQLFGIIIGPVVYLTTVLTVISIVVIYYLIYLKTSKTYYHQVSRRIS